MGRRWCKENWDLRSGVVIEPVQTMLAGQSHPILHEVLYLLLYAKM